MKVKDLIRKLKSQNGELDVIMPRNTPVGNIVFVDRVKKSSYGFFGKNIPAIMLDSE